MRLLRSHEAAQKLLKTARTETAEDLIDKPDQINLWASESEMHVDKLCLHSHRQTLSAFSYRNVDKLCRLKVPTGTTVDTILTLLLDSAHLSACSWLSVSQDTHA